MEAKSNAIGAGGEMKLVLCTYPGCGRLVRGGNRCEQHKAAAKRELFTERGKSGEWHGLYQSAAWRNLRRQFLAENPQCVVCGAAARIADHVVPHRGDKRLFYDAENLQALCVSCHSRKTLRENNFFRKNH